MADIMRVSEDYDDSEYDLNFILQEFQYGKKVSKALNNSKVQAKHPNSSVGKSN